MTMQIENILKHWNRRDLIQCYYQNISRAADELSNIHDQTEEYSIKQKRADTFLKNAKEYKQELINRNDTTLLF